MKRKGERAQATTEYLAGCISVVLAVVAVDVAASLWRLEVPKSSRQELTDAMKDRLHETQEALRPPLP